MCRDGVMRGKVMYSQKTHLENISEVTRGMLSADMLGDLWSAFENAASFLAHSRCCRT